MKEIIKRILFEEFKSKLNEWEKNLFFIKQENVITTLISENIEDDEYLYLIVGFKKVGDGYYYSYSFILMDNEGKPKTDFLTIRKDVKQYLPKEITNKKLIFSVIMKMTKNLLDNMTPQKILRTTDERLTGDSLMRYEKITDIMVNEYGYVLKNKYVDKIGFTHWILEKNDGINETEIIHLEHHYTKKEIIEMTFRPALKYIKDHYHRK